MSRAAVLVLTGFIAVFATAALAWSAAAALQQEPEVRLGQEVTICHATGNGKYVLQSPDADSIVSEHGHGSHPDDIIPPFDYPPSGQDPGGHYPGQHWRSRGRRSWTTGAWSPCRPPRPYPLGNFVKCVDNFDNGSFSAVFGYENPNAIPVNLERGAANNVSRRSTASSRRRSSQARSSFVHDREHPRRTDVTWTLENVPGNPTETTATAGFGREVHAAGPGADPPNAGIFVTCVENGTSTFSATFGYTNDGDTLIVPVGPQNAFAPGPVDRGQPTEFLPGDHPTDFTVSGITNGTSLTWTIASGNASRSGSPVAEATADFPTKCGVDPPDPPRPA